MAGAITPKKDPVDKDKTKIAKPLKKIAKIIWVS